MLKLNEVAADRYVAVLTQLKQRYGLTQQIDLRTLALMPDLFEWEHAAVSDDETWTLVKRVVDASCDNMNGMKAREGDALAKDLIERLRLIREQLDVVSVRAPYRPQEAKERLEGRLKQLLGDVEMDPLRVAQEIALMVDRLDCTEECVRLAAHLDQFRSLIEGQELAGRKLNFLLQEMNREANTIGSKSNDVEITRGVIIMKEEIERLREQVQNVE